MNRKQILWVALDSVFVIVFNIFFFALAGADKPASVWVNYGFIHVAYALMLCTPLLVRRGTGASADHGRPLYLGTSVYFLVALGVGVAFIIASPEGAKTSWLVHAGLLAVAAVYVLANMISNEHVADSMERQEEELKYVRGVSARLKALAGDAASKGAARKIGRLYDTISASPVRSGAQARPVEVQVAGLLADLEEAVAGGQAGEQERLADEMLRLANRRNALLG